NNCAGANSHLQGAGEYGGSASKGTERNEGGICPDCLVPTLDDEGNITSSSYWHPSSRYLSSTGMVAGSTDSGQGDATATNTGTTTVNNAGLGMMALSGGTAIHQRPLNPTTAHGATQSARQQPAAPAASTG
ncbi:hypothetical protein, partial [Salmonella enterica]|uniref:hypothetical protein n=1 Tax=Salmonella enterica TaxID=28901 RepID=UPI000B1E10D8